MSGYNPLEQARKSPDQLKADFLEQLKASYLQLSELDPEQNPVMHKSLSNGIQYIKEQLRQSMSDEEIQNIENEIKKQISGN